MDKITLSNVGTYKEIEYLKKTLGPVLVSALSEICVKRPADPIEYLGHWLLRWRYNEELRRRDMQNALETIRQKQAAKCEREASIAQCRLPLDPYGEGVTRNYPFLPPGYGGPLTEDDLKKLEKPPEEEEYEEYPGETDFATAEYDYETPGEGYDYNIQMEMPGEGYYDTQQYEQVDIGQPNPEDPSASAVMNE